MTYARWATVEEFKEKLAQINYNSEIKKSGIPMMYDDNNLYIKDDETHTMVIGSTGSGKTQTTLLPQLRLAAKAGESIIVHDVKGEIYETLCGELAKQNYNIVVIDLANTEKGNKFNPLSLPYKLYKEGKKDKAVEILENIAYYFCASEKYNPNIDPFWVNSASSLFTGLALYLFENANEDEININSIARLTNDFDKVSDYVKSSGKSTQIYMYLSSIVLAPTETKGSILSVFMQNIKMFATRESLSNLMSETDFDIESIQKEKTVLFIISENKQQTRRLIPLIIDECYRASVMTNEISRRLNILIDESENLIAIKEFVNMLTAARSYNIKFAVFIKSFLDLKNTYGTENTELLKMALSNIIYLLSTDVETLSEISKLC